jgi:hypothetical protein
MRRSGRLACELRRLKAGLLIVAGLLFVCHRAAIIVEPQARDPLTRSRTPPATKTRAQANTGVAGFRHETHRPPKAKLNCSDCHAIPSHASPDLIAAATKTSIKGYPYHDSCLPCHRMTRPQFFRGQNPVICTVCHTRSSPRLTSRDVLPFPGQRVIAHDFPGYFPHGLHQSLMARGRRPAGNISAGLTIRSVSFGSTAPDKEPHKEICSSCHFTDKRNAIELPLKGIPREASFGKIETDTFKTVPGDHEANAHGYCFNCHWQAQKPTKDDCNGCHLLQSDYAARKLEVLQPPEISTKAMTWFEDWPAGLPKRLSLKFRHDTHTVSPDGKTESNNHDVGCTTCHVNIAQMTTLNIPKADVQITACAPCHTKTASIPVGQGNKVTIFDELSLKADQSKNYVCVACHISVIGREPTPCTHYSVIGEPCPTFAQSGEK